MKCFSYWFFGNVVGGMDKFWLLGFLLWVSGGWEWRVRGSKEERSEGGAEGMREGRGKDGRDRKRVSDEESKGRGEVVLLFTLHFPMFCFSFHFLYYVPLLYLSSSSLGKDFFAYGPGKNALIVHLGSCFLPFYPKTSHPFYLRI